MYSRILFIRSYVFKCGYWDDLHSASVSKSRIESFSGIELLNLARVSSFLFQYYVSKETGLSGTMYSRKLVYQELCTQRNWFISNYILKDSGLPETMYPRILVNQEICTQGYWFTRNYVSKDTGLPVTMYSRIMVIQELCTQG